MVDRAAVQVVAAGGQLLEIDACAEGRVGAREHDRAHVLARVEVGERSLELGEELPRQRVAGLRPRQRHDGDVVGGLDGDELRLGSHVSQCVPGCALAPSKVSVSTGVTSRTTRLGESSPAMYVAR